MKNGKLKLTLITLGSIVATFVIFKLFFIVTAEQYGYIVESYCKFGWVPEKYVSFTIPFKIPNFRGKLTLIDRNGRQLSNADYTVLVNGEKTGTSFNSPGGYFVRVKIRGNSNRVVGRTFIGVKGGGRDVTFKYFYHRSNPLVYCLIFIITAVLFVIVLWYVFLQRIFYPRFKNITKTIIIPYQAPLVIKCRGYREIVLTKTGQKQGYWDKIVKGPIVYKVSSVFEEQVRLKPTAKGRKILVSASSNYRCTPNPIDGSRPATLENLSNKQKITIN